MAIIVAPGRVSDPAADFEDTSRFIRLRRLLRTGDPLELRLFLEGVVEPALHQPEGRDAVAGRSWARSGARSSTSSGVSRSRAARPVGSWEAALDRACRTWERLTGEPASPGECSEAAAAAILALAVALWPDVAASMSDQDGELGGV